tara:strand:+ start:1503 stop:1946 length:444 start_codon:yes stop_codon:yes gene_type:complete
MKKIPLLKICFLFLIFLQGCGYKPIYSSKNFLFKINKIDYEINSINNQIAGSLKSISNENAQNSLNLELNSKKEKRIVSKNKSGDAEIFELEISINIIVDDEQRTFSALQSYNNNENKFELNEYEIEIEKQIINEIFDDILIYLAKF